MCGKIKRRQSALELLSDSGCRIDERRFRCVLGNGVREEGIVSAAEYDLVDIVGCERIDIADEQFMHVLGVKVASFDAFHQTGARHIPDSHWHRTGNFRPFDGTMPDIGVFLTLDCAAGGENANVTGSGVPQRREYGWFNPNDGHGQTCPKSTDAYGCCCIAGKNQRFDLLREQKGDDVLKARLNVLA